MGEYVGAATAMIILRYHARESKASKLKGCLWENGEPSSRDDGNKKSLQIICIRSQSGRMFHVERKSEFRLINVVLLARRVSKGLGNDSSIHI